MHTEKEISPELKSFISAMMESFGDQLRQERAQSMQEIQTAFRLELENIRTSQLQSQLPPIPQATPYQTHIPPITIESPTNNSPCSCRT